MREYNIDFHIHTKYSGGTSQNMILPIIAEQAMIKGLDAVGTGDALHTKWRKHLKDNLVMDGDEHAIKNASTRFLITTEVEDARRVHHVILFPSISSAQDLYERVKRYSKDIDADGRPHIRLTGEEIVEIVSDVGGLVGPSHAFTPWTAIYKEYDSIAECYGDQTDRIKFLELGLSADTYMADRIGELSNLVFMSNSDCHSPWPHRLGREFNKVMLETLTFSEVEKALDNKDGRRFTLNVGLNPREGKYHVTACTRCFVKFHYPDAESLRFRCPECRGLIKKGVTDRINELATSAEPTHPGHRPPYVHIIPLAEVIALSMNIKTLTGKKVTSEYARLVGELGNEITILVDTDIPDIAKQNPKVAGIIQRFRRGDIQYTSGGGGMYGRPTLEAVKDEYYGHGQATLSRWDNI